MSANTNPIFTLVPNVGLARIAAANTARDGSGTLVTAFTAGPNGSRLNSIKFTSAQATAALSSTMVVRVFITDTSGANPRLFFESKMTTLTPSATVIGSTAIFDFLAGTTTDNTTPIQINVFGGLALASGQLVKVAQSVFATAADQNDVIVIGGDF